MWNRNKGWYRAVALLAAALLALALAGCGGAPAAKASAQASPPAQTTAQATAAPDAAATARPSPSAGPSAEAEAGAVSVLFINVGKADAALVRAAGKAYLIDTGEKSSAPQLIRALHLAGVGALDGVFLTHTHSDHIGGMETLAQYWKIGALYSANFSENKKNGGNKIEELAQELSLTHKKLAAGDAVEIAPGLRFEVLAPLVYNEDDDNDNSLVLRLRAHGRTLLFTGDMQFPEEETLLNAGTDLSADVLKVGNHGNPDATGDKFAAAVSPEIAVISTDTKVDTDSANARVKAALKGAEICVTQDYACGVLLAVEPGGALEVTDPEVPQSGMDLAITAIDKEEQSVTIENRGADADLSGCFLLSEKGSEVFVFPEGAALAAGRSATVSCKDGEGDYHWAADDKVWNTKKEDAGVLYDRFGNELSRWKE